MIIQLISFFSEFNENSITNHNPQSQVENYENENDSESTETNNIFNSQFSTSCQKYYQGMK